MMLLRWSIRIPLLLGLAGCTEPDRATEEPNMGSQDEIYVDEWVKGEEALEHETEPAMQNPVVID